MEDHNDVFIIPPMKYPNRLAQSLAHAVHYGKSSFLDVRVTKST